MLGKLSSVAEVIEALRMHKACRIGVSLCFWLLMTVFVFAGGQLCYHGADPRPNSPVGRCVVVLGRSFARCACS